ncbi:hypothetical protein B0H12DRAFT_1159952 [Mycena haematopus]|nr:hypothetical protein B0H12DRAFT_1159952 [Mycena haematopus]
MDSSGSSLRPRATRSYQELPADVRRLRAATRLWRAAIKSYQKGDLATGLRELLWLPNATYTSAFFLMEGGRWTNEVLLIAEYDYIGPAEMKRSVETRIPPRCPKLGGRRPPSVYRAPITHRTTLRPARWRIASI